MISWKKWAHKLRMKFIYGNQVTTSFKCSLHCFVIYSYPFCIIIEHSRWKKNNRSSIRWCENIKHYLRCWKNKAFTDVIFTSDLHNFLSLSLLLYVLDSNEKKKFVYNFVLFNGFVCMYLIWFYMSFCCYFCYSFVIHQTIPSIIFATLSFSLFIFNFS